MLRRAEVTATLDHPVERVFAYLSDPLSWHAFAPACVYRRQIGAEPPAVGTRWEATDLIGPFPMRFVDELVELEPNRRVVWWSSAPWNARVEYACQPDGIGGTHIHATYQGDISGWLRILVGWLPPRLTRWILAQDFRRLGRVLEGERYRSEARANPDPAGWGMDPRAPEAP
jgi:uncharacterized protein YndB with AHSA1/START domain